MAYREGKRRVRKQNILAVMVENAVTEFGLFEGDELVASWRLSTPACLTVDEARLQLASGLQRFAAAVCGGCGAAEAGLPQGATAVLGSVVPALTEVWRDALAAETGQRVLVMGPRLKTGMAIASKNPGEVGADRVADAVAARAMVGAPAVVVHLEAATAITVVDAKGALAGGVIAPGFEASSATLAQVAARLPEVEAVVPKNVMGKTTQEAIASGVFWGEVARIDGLVAMLEREMLSAAAPAAEIDGPASGGHPGVEAPAVAATSGASAAPGAPGPTGLAPATIPVLITGEGAAALAPHLRCRPQLVPHLTLQGLALAARHALGRS